MINNNLNPNLVFYVDNNNKEHFGGTAVNVGNPHIVFFVNNIEDFIPVGSLIEHENSFSIPPGTTIDSINAAGEITLSREIIVDPSTATISSWGWTDVSE